MTAEHKPERRLITWKQLCEDCVECLYVSCEHYENESGNLSPNDCPIWKRLPKEGE